VYKNTLNHEGHKYLVFIDWIGLDWIGLDWIGLDWIGLDWSTLIYMKVLQ
jgi:hypothetical protein